MSMPAGFRNVNQKGELSMAGATKSRRRALATFALAKPAPPELDMLAVGAVG